VRALLPALAAILVAALFAALAAAASARSSDVGLGVPGDQSAGDQYVESLPTAKGPRAPARNKHRKPGLGRSDAAILRSLATSPALGAPAHRGVESGGGRHKGSNAERSRDARSDHLGRHGGSSATVPSAAVNAVDEGETGLGWLVLAILGITAVSLGAVAYKRRKDKGSVG
jgi:hypothetical protein